MKLVIIRRPEVNRDMNEAGEPNAPSVHGQEQLAHIAEVCREEGVQAVVHSTMARVAIAAGSLAQTLGVPAIKQEGLQERTFGDWDKWEWPEIAAELAKLSSEERYTFVPPNGESWQQMEERLRVALGQIATLNYDSVAIMMHIGAMRAFLPLVRHEPKESTLQLMPDNGELFIQQYTETA